MSQLVVLRYHLSLRVTPGGGGHSVDLNHNQDCSANAHFLVLSLKTLKFTFKSYTVKNYVVFIIKLYTLYCICFIILVYKILIFFRECMCM